ncbi:MAG: hypothetical protein V7707_00975 [Motiliproteus sp.]
MTPKKHADQPCVHPFLLRDTYRLLSTLPLSSKSDSEIAELTEQLANARSLREINQLLRALRNSQ